MPQTTITYDKEVNVFIGPSMERLIHFGAKYGLCMRQDDSYLTQRGISLELEQNKQLGCCVDSATKQCGMASQDVCGGDWNAGRCSEAQCAGVWLMDFSGIE